MSEPSALALKLEAMILKETDLASNLLEAQESFDDLVRDWEATIASPQFNLNPEVKLVTCLSELRALLNVRLKYSRNEAVEIRDTNLIWQGAVYEFPADRPLSTPHHSVLLDSGGGRRIVSNQNIRKLRD